MMRAVVAFLGVWALVFFGISYFWHISREEKFDIIKISFYSFMTAFIAFVLLTALVILF